MIALMYDLDSFFSNPIHLAIVIASLSISFALFMVLRLSSTASNSKKLAMAYGHIFTLVFPVIYFTYSTGCRMMFNHCNQINIIIYISFMALASAFITAVLIAPFFILRNFRKKAVELKDNMMASFVNYASSLLAIKSPKVYLLKISKPIAFSFSHFKKSIFISAGMADLLTKKEIEAVILHELHHIKSNSSSLKMSHFIMSKFTPFAKLASFHSDLSEEEAKADNLAVEMQGTSKYLNSAKRKLDAYFNFKSEFE